MSVWITQWEDTRALVKHEQLIEVEDLALMVAAPPQVNRKEEAPLFKLALYGDTPTASGCLRHDANVIAISGLEGDYDGEKISIQEAKKRLERENIKAILYTSPSHRKTHPRWRVLAPFTESIEGDTTSLKAARTRLMRRLDKALGGLLSPESYNLSQSYYIGHVVGRDYDWTVSQGKLIDEIGGLDDDASADSHIAAQDEAERVPLSERQIAEIEAAIKLFPADDRQTWLDVGMILHSDIGGQRGYEIWSTWSQTSPKFDPKDQWRVWQSFRRTRGDRLTRASLFSRAYEAGWTGYEEPKKALPPDGILSAAHFAAQAKPPEYVIDGVIRRGFFYALTGLSNAGKTAIALSISVAVNRGEPLGGVQTKQGNVLFLAGENPEDVRWRVMAMAQDRFSTPAELAPHLWILPHIFSLSAGQETIQNWARSIGGLDLVVIDSKAAYFSGEDENSNTDSLRQAKDARAYTEIEGNPAVLMICHPTKWVDSQANLVPRGGSSFLNEIDTNLTAWKDAGDTTQLWHTKIRGLPFDPLIFDIKPWTLQGMKTSMGRSVTSVIAKALTRDEPETEAAVAVAQEDSLLVVMKSRPKGSVREWCEALGWLTEAGLPHKSKLHRTLQHLLADKLIHRPRKSGPYVLTKKGKEVAEYASSAQLYRARK